MYAECLDFLESKCLLQQNAYINCEYRSPLPKDAAADNPPLSNAVADTSKVHF